MGKRRKRPRFTNGRDQARRNLPAPTDSITPENGHAMGMDLSEIGEPKPPRPANRTRGEGRIIASESWAGPLPHPAILEHFEAACPGSSRDIVNEFKAQGKHRRRLESWTVATNNVSSVMASIGAWVLFAGIIGAGTYVALQGKDLAGFGFIVSAVI